MDSQPCASYSEIEEKATKLLEEAERKSKNSKSFFKNLFGFPIDTEQASELANRAANLFKSIKKWEYSGKAFLMSAQLILDNDQYSIEAASNFVDAYNVFKRVDVQEAINCLNKAINIYVYLGKFNTAAKCHLNIAEMYDKDALDIDKAIENYEISSDYYRGDGHTKLSDDCMLKVALLFIQKEEFIKAASIFEKIGYDRMNSSMLKYAARQQLFYAAICHFRVDVLNAKLAIKRYKKVFPAFEDFRECKFIEKIIESYENEDVDTFTNIVREYDNISKLDNIIISMLLNIKKSITSNSLR
ncbi:CRPV-039 [Crowpox virus]|nr:CRPV-039 [Crowpox virus]